MKKLFLAVALLCALTSTAFAAPAQSMNVEDFTQLDKFIAQSPSKIIEEIPDFADGYKKQKGKLDATGKALIAHLKAQMPYPFKALAGESKVDVVTIKSSGRTAYVFIVVKTAPNFIKPMGPGKFYYDLPGVLQTLNAFIATQKDLESLIYVDKGSGYFAFAVQKKK